MASLFNLAILEENTYKENNFKTNKLLSGKKPKQFTKSKDIEDYLKKLSEIYSHCLYIRNHILQHCKLKRYEKFINEYKKVIIMLSLADNKFDDRLNLKNSFIHIHDFFKAIKKTNSSGTNTDDVQNAMVATSGQLKGYLAILKKKELSETECASFQTNIKAYQSDLFKNIENIVNDYNRTSKELIECDYLNNFLKSINHNHPCNQTTFKHSILYYGFMINHNNILKLHNIVSKMTVIIDKIIKQ
jgi:hypothetical protein